MRAGLVGADEMADLPDEVRAFVAEKGEDGVDRGLRTLPSSELGEGDVVVRVARSSVNYKDALATIPKGAGGAHLAARAGHRPGGHGGGGRGRLLRGRRGARPRLRHRRRAPRRLRGVRARAGRLGGAAPGRAERRAGDGDRHGRVHGGAVRDAAGAVRHHARRGARAGDGAPRRRGLDRGLDPRLAGLRGRGQQRQGRRPRVPRGPRRVRGDRARGRRGRRQAARQAALGCGGGLPLVGRCSPGCSRRSATAARWPRAD